MASCSCGGCSSCSHTIGCMACIADGFICRVSSLTLCTMLGWHCTRSVFSCSTWSRILPCILSDEQTPTDPVAQRCFCTPHLQASTGNWKGHGEADERRRPRHASGHSTLVLAHTGPCTRYRTPCLRIWRRGVYQHAMLCACLPFFHKK